MGFGIALAVILAGHVAADFYVQTNTVAQGKQDRRSLLVVHCIAYGLCLTLFSALVFPAEAFLIAGLLFFVTHAALDFLKVELEKRKILSSFKLFSIDQVCHVIVCFGAVLCFYSDQSAGGLLSWARDLVGSEALSAMLSIALALLVSWRPASIAIQHLLSSVRKDGECGVSAEDDACAAEQRAGRWIGVLERTIVVVLTMYGQFGAIAFVLTAKSIARFNKLSEDKDFAECYLVGTLASSAIAILATLFFQNMVTWQMP